MVCLFPDPPPFTLPVVCVRPGGDLVYKVRVGSLKTQDLTIPAQRQLERAAGAIERRPGEGKKPSPRRSVETGSQSGAGPGRLGKPHPGQIREAGALERRPGEGDKTLTREIRPSREPDGAGPGKGWEPFTWEV